MKRLKDLPWESRFVDRMPGDPEPRNFVRQVRGALYSEVAPTRVLSPKLLGWSSELAAELGIARPGADDPESLELLAGNRVLPGMKPYSARYGGHQFGHWAAQLGDGRAITLGEVTTSSGARLEFQLKGAGPTPYSRRADGRAVLRSSVREFLCSEAMHYLGVPTTRALSLVSTGDEVIRDMFYDGNARAEPGAIVCRVSPSFLRFGNFEILTAQEEPELLARLADFLIEDHYPEIDREQPDRYALLLDSIARRTAHLVAEWQRVGFVHGVMNTDNLSALGLTIDYGPYGWLEPFDPDWTPNTTDAEGRRYRYGAQPAIAQWNLARLCEAFYPLVPDEERLMSTLRIYKEAFEAEYASVLARKLGLPNLDAPEDQALAETLFQRLAIVETDYTLFFRGLSGWNAASDGDLSGFRSVLEASVYSTIPEEGLSLWLAWAKDYRARVLAHGLSDSERSIAMKRVNPKYVLRNYLAQTAIQAAESGDTSVLERLQRVLRTPYDELPGDEELASRRPEWARQAPGCSALSCSS